MWNGFIDIYNKSVGLLSSRTQNFDEDHTNKHWEHTSAMTNIVSGEIKHSSPKLYLEKQINHLPTLPYDGTLNNTSWEMSQTTSINMMWSIKVSVNIWIALRIHTHFCIQFSKNSFKKTGQLLLSTFYMWKNRDSKWYSDLSQCHTAS